MEAQVSPTKGNLLAIKKSLELAKLGFDLLDRKQNILIRETVSYVSKAQNIEKDVYDKYKEAYSAMRLANMQLGLCDNIAKTCPKDPGIDIEYHSIMGVDIPVLHYKKLPPKNSYGYYDTTLDLDKALILFNEAKYLTYELSEIENSVFRLSEGIRKTQKRANALKNIIIPRMTEQIKFITAALEEKEREEFTRLKVIKNQLEEKR